MIHILIFAFFLTNQEVSPEKKAINYFINELLYNKNICSESETSTDTLYWHIGINFIKSKYPSYCENGLFFDKEICSDFNINSVTVPIVDKTDDTLLWEGYLQKKGKSKTYKVKNKNSLIRQCSFEEFLSHQNNDLLYMKVRDEIQNRDSFHVQVDFISISESCYLSLYFIIKKESNEIDWTIR